MSIIPTSVASMMSKKEGRGWVFFVPVVVLSTTVSPMLLFLFRAESNHLRYRRSKVMVKVLDEVESFVFSHPFNEYFQTPDGVDILGSF